MNNQYCRDYLMHAKKGGFFNSLVSFGENLADKNAAKKQQQAEYEAQRAQQYANEENRKANTVMANDPRYFKDTRGTLSTTDPRYQKPKPSGTLATTDPRYQEQDGGFDKKEYNRQYYQQHKEDWQKGGKYYKLKATVKRAISGLKNAASNPIRTLQGLGEKAYDATHRKELGSLNSMSNVNFGPTSNSRVRAAGRGASDIALQSRRNNRKR